MERCSPHVSLIPPQVSDYFTRLGNRMLFAKRLQPVNLDPFDPISIDLIRESDALYSMRLSTTWSGLGNFYDSDQ